MTIVFTISELATIACADSVEGRITNSITGIAPLTEASSTDLSFLANIKYVEAVKSSLAGAILVPIDYVGKPNQGQVFLRVQNPSYSLALICSVLEARLWPRPTPGIHPTAVVAPSAEIDPSVSIGPLCAIGEGSKILNGSVIESHCSIGMHTKIGEDCWIKPNVVIGDYCVIGARCRIQSGAVVGADGFGYEPMKGANHRIPQIGNVVLENDVEIGANSTLDRARFSQTLIGQGTKIDNLVQIAHNVRIGRHCLIAAQSGIAGSTILGDYCVLGGQSGIAGHLTIGERVKLGAQTGLFEDVAPDSFMNGTPAIAFGIERRIVVLSRRLPELFKKVDALVATLNSAES